MRILLITALYYPARSPNVYRWGAIAKHWAQQGHEVHLLCTCFSGEPDEELRDGLHLHRAGHHTLLDALYNWLGRNERRGAVGTKTQSKPGWMRRFFEKTADLTWRKLYWPDGSCLWYFPAKKKALQLAQRLHFDAVISVSLPFTAALIAKTVKQQYPEIHWLMDIEDPFAISAEFFVNNRALYKSLNFKAEARALRLADAVAVTNEGARKRYLEHFSFLGKKLSVVPPLCEPAMQGLPNLQGLVNLDPGKTHLGYFGTFYKNVRSPEGWLNLLRAAFSADAALKTKWAFHFAGEVPIALRGVFDLYPDLKNSLLFHGLLPREQVAVLMRRMDFLVNIGNSTDYHLPSKAAEYWMSGQPVINVACREEDTFAAFFEKYPLLLNLVLPRHQADNQSLVQLIDFVTKNIGKEADSEWVRREGAEFSLENVAEKYLQLISGSAAEQLLG